jgi:hypothetical protein
MYASSASPTSVALKRGASCRSVLAIALAAIGFAGTADAAPKSPKSRDVTPPQTTITAQPPATTTEISASFSMSSNEPASFECKLDATAFVPCLSPQAYSALSVGSHAFHVRAKDVAGNVDATPASYAWEVTAPAPAPPPASGAVTVPAAVASDCSVNVQEQLTSFINAQPNGTLIDFPANGCYAQNARIEVRDKADLTINANGSTFRSSAPNDGCKVQPNWLLLRGRNLTLKNAKIIGNFNPPATVKRSAAAVSQYAQDTCSIAGNAFNMGIGVYGGEGIAITDSDIEQVYGDGVAVNVAWYLTNEPDHALDKPSNVRVERTRIARTARHGFSPSQGQNVWLTDSQISDCWYYCMDAELDDAAQKLQGIHVLRNTWRDYFMGAIIVPVVGNGDNVKDIEIRHNVFETVADNFCNDIVQIGTIHYASPSTITNVVVDNNNFTRSAIGVHLDRVAGASIQNNRDTYVNQGCGFYDQSAAAFTKVTNSSGVTIADNTATSAGASTP